MRQKLLLIEDVDCLGRSGEVVSVRVGYARNFLLPKSQAVAVDKQTLKMQDRLQRERAIRAASDKKDSEAMAAIIEGMTLETQVKVDQEGKMYGSVSALDVFHLFQEKEIAIEKRNIDMKKPIKDIGISTVQIKLKEGVTAKINLKITGEGMPEVELPPEIVKPIEAPEESESAD